MGESNSRDVVFPSALVGPMSDSRTIPNPRTFRERFGALKTLRPFMAMVWRTSPSLTMGLLVLRVLRALLPVVILVLADGKVEAAGTHDELVAQAGRYAELFELQAAGYR